MFSWISSSSLLAVVGLLASGAEAWGPKTWEQQKADRFFKCLLAIEYADQNNDSRLDTEEYIVFVDKYASLLFDEDWKNKEPVDLIAMYDQLATESGGPDGNTQIDVFGAGFFDLANVDQVRIDKLHEVCEDSAKAIAGHGHSTQAPKMVNLETLLKQEKMYGRPASVEEEDEEESGHA